MNDLGKSILLDRYARENETTIEDVFKRVADTVGQNSAERKRFYEAMSQKKFIPAGRILAADKERTYYNCYVLPSPKDSREGIVKTLHQILEIQSRGGGIGVNISSLRPRGAIAKKVGGHSSGSVSWAGLYSYATGLVEQGGSRRGATMIILNDWHPDLLDFIDSKRKAGAITNANISVGISDAFMNAVKNDLEWNLVFPDTSHKDYDAIWDGDLEKWKERNLPVVHYKTVKAKEVWRKIMESAWASAEPGVWFRDRANAMSNSWYYTKLICTNPCFTGDTEIFTPAGKRTAKDLYDRGEGFFVTIDKRFGKGKITNASKVFKTGTKPVFRVSTYEGYSIRLTNNHKIMTPNGWVEVQNLSVGDIIHVLDDIASISEISPDGIEDVYDVNVPTTHSLIANGIVIHNCGEIGLQGFAVCNLGHVNLSRMFISGEQNRVDWISIINTTKMAVHFLDNIVDVTPYHFKENELVQKGERRVGIGTMGFAELLIHLGIRYGSQESVELAEKIQRIIAIAAYRESSDMALEKGSFPQFDADKFLASGFMQTMPEDLRVKIKTDGIRNAFLLTQAPTGTVGTMINTSTGIEPFFSFKHYRKTRMGFFEEKHPIIDGVDELQDYHVTTMDIAPEEHVAVACAFQKWIDNSISKTVNLPNSASVEDVATIYNMLYENGGKGGTVYRDGSRDEQILHLTSTCEECGEDAVVEEAGCKTCHACGFSACSI